MPISSKSVSPEKRNDKKLTLTEVSTCPQCNGQISEGKFVTIPNSNVKLHSDCFRCYNNCGVKLVETGFARIQNKFYCPNCANKVTAAPKPPMCYVCGKFCIGACITVKGLTFHKECFACFSCKCALSNKFF